MKKLLMLLVASTFLAGCNMQILQPSKTVEQASTNTENWIIHCPQKDPKVSTYYSRNGILTVSEFCAKPELPGGGGENGYLPEILFEKYEVSLNQGNFQQNPEIQQCVVSKMRNLGTSVNRFNEIHKKYFLASPDSVSKPVVWPKDDLPIEFTCFTNVRQEPEPKPVQKATKEEPKQVAQTAPAVKEKPAEPAVATTKTDVSGTAQVKEESVIGPKASGQEIAQEFGETEITIIGPEPLSDPELDLILP
jgi:hypothetical protein